MGYADVSTATATQNPLEQAAPTYINFGAGYIDAPTSQTQTPNQSATAALGSAGVGTGPNGSEGTVGGLTAGQLLIVFGGGSLVFLAAVFLITHKEA
jgi:hypothetical protein